MYRRQRAVGARLLQWPCSKPRPIHSSPMTAAADPRRNRLLAALPDEVWQRWRPELEPVDLPLGKVLYESGGTLSHVYFPTTAIVSLLYVTENGQSAEIAVVGNEGVVGISLFMGGETTLNRAVVQSAGRRLSAGAQTHQGRVRRDPAAVHAPVVALHAGADHADGADGRVQSPPFDRSATVPLAAAEPGSPAGHRADDDAGADRQHARRASRRRDRGRRQAAERRPDRATRAAHQGARSPGLERRTCECYAVVKAEYARLLPDRTAT